MTINLFSEDIIAILNSGGLIGISMDVRIIGAKEDTSTPQFDYISFLEYEILALDEDARDVRVTELADAISEGRAPVPQRQQDIPDTPDFVNARAAEAFEIMPSGTFAVDGRQNFEFHAKQIANQLLKILDVTVLYGLNHPWDHVCIGSDFDGLIEAVDCCKNATEYENLVPVLIRELEAGAAITGLDLQISATQIVNQFCYTNALNFINNHFTS